MKLHKNKIQKKQSQQARRKFKTNSRSKSQEFDARVVVTKSLTAISAQVIAHDGHIIAAISDADMKGDTKSERAFAAGQTLAASIKQSSAEKVIFDRNGYLYHGRVKAFADGLREGGIAL